MVVLILLHVNYDDSADYEDFSCTYALAGFDCDGAYNGSACGYDNVLCLIVRYLVQIMQATCIKYMYTHLMVWIVGIAWTSGDT